MQDTATIKRIVSQAAAGVSQCAIAQEIGVHESTISRIVHKPDLQEIIKSQTLRLVTQAAEDAVTARIKVVNGFAKMLDDPESEQVPKLMKGMSPKDAMHIGLRECQGVRQTIGIDPSHTPSVILQSIHNGDTIHIDQYVAQLATGFATAPPGEVHEAEFVDDLSGIRTTYEGHNEE